MSDSPSTSIIRLCGCRQHNLKNFSIALPKQAITVLTGVSGSGKTSFAFDTLFAEGQRRYLEYLSSQARSWIKQVAKPDVDLIEGLSPTLAVGQGRHELFPRGNVATYTDIYDFLSLLYAKIGEQHDPITGNKLTRYSRQEIIHLVLKEFLPGTRIQLLAPVKLQHENAHQAIARLQQMGYVRMKMDGQEWTSESPLPPLESISQLDVIVDRLEIKEGIRERLAPSIETAMDLSQGILKVQEGREGAIHFFTEIYVSPETSLSFAPLTPSDFNFLSPRGACPHCHGEGGKEEIIPELLFNPQQSLSAQVELILEKLPKKIRTTFNQLFQGFLVHYQLKEETKVAELSEDILNVFLYGSPQIKLTISLPDRHQKLQTTWQGFIPFLNRLLTEKKSKGSLSELPIVEWKVCPVCHGGRLKAESLACLIKGKNIATLCQLTVTELLQEIGSWSFSGNDLTIANEILPAIQTRLTFLQQVGLGYLELNRQGRTLSDGEAQRIQLAAHIGAKLSGIIYVDEPSLGLHRQDIRYLNEVIQELKMLDNTIIMVEHERGLISQADEVVELGPGAGQQGGYVTFQGSYQELLQDTKSLTGAWLSHRKQFPKPPLRKGNGHLSVKNAHLHNLDNFSVKIPLGILVGFCGVSGSGKSTLALDLIGIPLRQSLTHPKPLPWLEGYQSFKRVVLGEKLAERYSARSIPATYVNLMTPLRQLFAETRLAKARGYTPSRFSLNKRGGRCEACEGLGQVRVKMGLMSDLFIPCDVCQGQRYNYETLQVTWEGKNISEVLNLSIDEAAQLFRYIPSLAPSLELMQELGLGYLTLGQPFTTLSGGEIQRLKLVGDLLQKSQEPTLYILDEPSAGLHFEDILKLINILHRLVDQGHSLFVIEHHLDLLQQCDWLIELGPGGGPQGGHLLFQGTPKQLLKATTPTALALKNLR